MFNDVTERLFERVRDAYGDPGELLEAIGLSYGELLELLNDNNLLTQETLPFIYVVDEIDNDK